MKPGCALGAARRRRQRRTVCGLLGAFVVLVIVAAGTGAVFTPAREVLDVLSHHLFGGEPSEAVLALSDVVWGIRLPRVILATLVGGTLAVSGAALQGLFRNPLADPGLIGVSSGAALATSVALVVGSALLESTGVAAPWWLALAGFLGGVSATLLLLSAARNTGERLVTTLLLGGIALNAAAAAGTGAMTVIATDSQLRSLSFWLLGSLGSANWSLVMIAAVPMLLSVLMLLGHAETLDLLLLGEREAGHLGLDVARATRRVVLWSALGVGSSVAFAGGIGFIGLVVPHLVRMGLGASHRAVLPVAALGGSVLLLAADTVARTVVAPVELPVGVVTAFIGAPMLMWMVTRRESSRAARIA